MSSQQNATASHLGLVTAVDGSLSARPADAFGSREPHAAAPGVYLMRLELNQILHVYGRMVAAGEWRDYSLDFGIDEASFSIYRRASEAPLYRVIKAPSLAKRQGAWRIVNMHGSILKRGRALDQLLRYFDRIVMRAENRE